MELNKELIEISAAVSLLREKVFSDEKKAVPCMFEHLNNLDILLTGAENTDYTDDDKKIWQKIFVAVDVCICVFFHHLDEVQYSGKYYCDVFVKFNDLLRKLEGKAEPSNLKVLRKRLDGFFRKDTIMA